MVNKETVTYWLFHLATILCANFCLISSFYFISRYTNIIAWKSAVDDHFDKETDINYYDNGCFKDDSWFTDENRVIARDLFIEV